MTDKNKILAIIPARGGSRGIANKNISMDSEQYNATLNNFENNLELII